MRPRGRMILKGDKSWLLRIYRGQVNGKKKYASKAFKGTTAQARQELTKMLREEDTDTFVPTSKLLLRDYLDRWLAGKIDISPNTRVSYGQMLKRVKEHLGHIRLTELETISIQQLVKKTIDENLAPRSIRYSVRVLRGALEDAVQDGALVKNPARRVKLPKQERREGKVLTVPQMNALFEATANDPAGPLWRLLLTTGMRPQEAYGLKWTDINFEDGSVSIQRTLVSDGHGKYTIRNSVKADSQRRITLPASTIAVLRALKKSQSVDALSLGASFERAGLVFTNRYGRPMDDSRTRRWWKQALAKTRTPDGEPLPDMRLYDARHTHLTQLLANGLGLAFVAARAGHKDVSMTAKHYAHVLPESHKMMGEFTERMIQGG